MSASQSSSQGGGCLLLLLAIAGLFASGFLVPEVRQFLKLDAGISTASGAAPADKQVFGDAFTLGEDVAAWNKSTGHWNTSPEDEAGEDSEAATHRQMLEAALKKLNLSIDYRKLDFSSAMTAYDYSEGSAAIQQAVRLSYGSKAANAFSLGLSTQGGFYVATATMFTNECPGPYRRCARAAFEYLNSLLKEFGLEEEPFDDLDSIHEINAYNDRVASHMWQIKERAEHQL